MTQSKYAGAELESSPRHATDHEAWLDEIEPLEEKPRDLIADALAAVLAKCMSGKPVSSALNPEHLSRQIESSYRRFFALILVLKPELLPADLPHHKWAEILGVTRQGLSLRCVEWSDFLGGLKSGSMKSGTARQIYSEANNRKGNTGKPHRRTGGIGQRTEQMGAQTQRILAEAVGFFRDGKPWSKLHRRELRLAGYIGDADELTAEGRQRLAQGQEAAPMAPAN